MKYISKQCCPVCDLLLNDYESCPRCFNEYQRFRYEKVQTIIRQGKRLSSDFINKIYGKYKMVFFLKLLEDPKVSPEDKVKIKELLKKPWNPYIRRHSALTEKSQI